MSISSVPELSLIPDPPVGFYFMVVFLAGGILPNLLDIRFQKVSGLTSTIETQEIKEGGENLFVSRLPTRVTYDNLILERGVVIGSLLSAELNTAMSTLRFQPANVLVMLLNAQNSPIANWLCQNAYPVKWSISGLDANQNAVVIETMELTYSRLQRVKI